MGGGGLQPAGRPHLGLAPRLLWAASRRAPLGVALAGPPISPSTEVKSDRKRIHPSGSASIWACFDTSV